MTTIEAVYEHGVFKPLEIPPFGDGQHVLIIAKLPEKQKKSLSSLIGTLSAEEAEEMQSLINKEFSRIEEQPQKRIFGIDAGKGWISEDFNAPLPDAILREFE